MSAKQAVSAGILEVSGVAGWLVDAGYEGIKDFWRNSGIPISHETVRRAASGGEATAWSLFLIMRALGFDNSRMKNELEKVGDSTLAPYLSDGVILTEDEEGILQLWRNIKTTGGKNAIKQLVNILCSIREMMGLPACRGLRAKMEKAISEAGE